MKISAKARYGLAAVVSMAENIQNECTTVISLAEKLNISKIYLEQVFALLKRGHIVTSTKGAQGGYTLSKPASDISVFDILSAIETSLFDKTDKTVNESDEIMEKAIQETVFEVIDHSFKKILTNISLADIVSQVQKYRNEGNYMYYL